MFRAVTDRLLSVLQLTRMALVFTAVADAQAALLLAGRWEWQTSVAAAGMSVGLYGFGMTFNDIVDQRRDAQIAKTRPLPSGRLRPVTAHLLAALLLIAGLGFGAWLATMMPDFRMTLTLVVATAVLIAFYDLAGKYLVAPGLLALGMIRFFHAVVPASPLPVELHALVLLHFVAALSAVCYGLEQKRPLLRPLHVMLVLAGLAVMDAAILYRRGLAIFEMPPLAVASLLFALLGFAVAGGWLVSVTRDSRALGKRLMLVGLLWLIVLDAAFVLGHVGIVPALCILALLPIAYGCVVLMRAWGSVVELSRKPDFISEDG
ncbi:MAG: UbiA family prenyltransferase [Planctomycetota bacterium]